MKPMLAAKNPIMGNIKFPVIATPKIDGIRCLKIDGKAVTRTLKPIPNLYIRALIEMNCLDGFDGEIICGDGFNEVQSMVMTQKGMPKFEYLVFDYVTDPSVPYSDRIKKLSKCKLPSFCRQLDDSLIQNLVELESIMEKHLVEGHEGTMIRSPESPYKYGRSTLKEGYLIALKNFKDGEAKVIGFEELFHNNNEKTKDELGHSKRASNLENLVAGDTLGAFIVEEEEVQFKIGTGKGLTHELRKHIWDNKDEYLGKLVHYRFQPHGTQDKPRIPIWHGFRDENDI